MNLEKDEGIKQANRKFLFTALSWMAIKFTPEKKGERKRLALFTSRPEIARRLIIISFSFHARCGCFSIKSQTSHQLSMLLVYNAC